VRPANGDASARPGRRFHRLFRADGRTVIVALDHGLTGLTKLGALARPAEILAAAAASGGDAVLVTPGIARAFPHLLGRVGVIVRLDGGVVTYYGEDTQEMRQLASVEDALRWGADGVALMGMIGTPEEASSLQRMAEVAADCDRWGMPLLAEMLPGGYGADVSVDEVATATRVACELGADIVKVPYCGSPEEYRRVITESYRPVVVLGGGRGPDVAERLRGALKAGASGVAVGRDIWLSADPAATTRELVELVHEEGGSARAGS